MEGGGSKVARWKVVERSLTIQIREVHFKENNQDA